MGGVWWGPSGGHWWVIVGRALEDLSIPLRSLILAIYSYTYQSTASPTSPPSGEKCSRGPTRLPTPMPNVQQDKAGQGLRRGSQSAP